MLSLNQVRVGTKILFQASPHEVVSAQHLKIGRGGAKLATKLRNLLNGTIFDYTFAGDERLEEAAVSYRQAQFLYAETDRASFMLSDDFSTVELTVGRGQLEFLDEGQPIDLLIWEGRPISLNLPKKVSLKVSCTEPAVSGNTVNAALKPATLETGATVQVPLFVKTGDTIIVNTESGRYDSRAN